MVTTRTTGQMPEPEGRKPPAQAVKHGKAGGCPVKEDGHVCSGAMNHGGDHEFVTET